MSKPIELALAVLKEAVEEDDYAIGWHANLSMAFYDAMGDDIPHEDKHRISNNGAARFMRLLFDIDSQAVHDSFNSRPPSSETIEED